MPKNYDTWLCERKVVYLGENLHLLGAIPNQLPPDVLDSNFFKRNVQVHSHETRHALDFYIDPTKTKLVENTKTQGALFWNSLDVSWKTAPLSIF